jgi:hypothetical protein
MLSRGWRGKRRKREVKTRRANREGQIKRESRR